MGGASNNHAAAGMLNLGKGVVMHDHGSIAIFLQCKDVSRLVDFRPSTTCYKDLPVFYQSKEMFRDSKTFVLKAHSVPVNCLTDFAIHRVGESYLKQGPELVNVTSMNFTVIQPDMDEDDLSNDWAFKSLGSLFGKHTTFIAFCF